MPIARQPRLGHVRMIVYHTATHDVPAQISMCNTSYAVNDNTAVAVMMQLNL
jgi:hypothetical protein